VRHVRGVPHGVVAALAQPELEQVAHARRDLDALQPRLPVAQQALVGGVCGDADRPGVRHGHRDGVETDGQADAEPLDQAGDGRDEPFPLQVGLRTGEEQERRAGRVAQQVQRQARLVVTLPVILHEDHRRSPGPVVEQLVEVEGREDLTVQLCQQMVTGELDGAPGVDEPGQSLDEHRCVQVGQVVGQLVEPLWVEHAADLLEMRPRGRAIW
jgi:hypothetical protein